MLLSTDCHTQARTPLIMEKTMETETKLKGKIIHISDEGWGFITSQDKKFTRIFFHWTALNGNTLKFLELKKGMEVSFILKEYPDKGARAIKIEVIQ